MGVELINRIWYKQEVRARKRLEELLMILSEFNGDLPWKSLFVRAADYRTKHESIREPGSIQDILKVVDQYSGEPLYLSISSAIPCWRFKGNQSELAYIPITISCWDKEHLDLTRKSRQLEGDARVLIDNTGPFTAFVDDEDLKVEENKLNKQVEENLEKLLQIIFAITKNNAVGSLKTFSANGMSHPLNAHLAYYNNAQDISNDLKTLDHLWNNGFKAYNADPLKNNPADPFLLNPYRSEAQRQELFDKFSKVSTNGFDVHEENIKQLDWNKFDNFESKYGRVVLNYPYFLNSFISPFYMELLRSK